jgi:MFS family permease
MPRIALGALGAVTIVAYGACYYAFGVLIEPIAKDTGWSAGALGAVFSVALVVTGVCGPLAGRLLDRAGTRPVFVFATVLGAVPMFVASFQTGLVPFGIAYGVGCGVVGGLAFYHVTQPAAARLVPAAPARAIIGLTIAGAFASPIFLPLTAKLATTLGWRDTIRVQALIVGIALVGASLLVTTPAARRSKAPVPIRAVLGSAWGSRAIRVWLVASLIGGAAADVMLVYQVPAMIAAGLPIAVASTLAGLRGFAQLAGRLPLGRVVSRLGTRRALVLTYSTGAVAAVVLFASGTIVVALVYSALAGASLGAISTLEGIYTHELVDSEHLGVLFGVQVAVFSIGGAAGPALAGGLLDSTGSFAPVAALVAIGFLTSALLLRRLPADAELVAAESAPVLPS